MILRVPIQPRSATYWFRTCRIQITYSLEDRIIDGTAESTLPEIVNMKNTNKEKTESPRNRQNKI